MIVRSFAAAIFAAILSLDAVFLSAAAEPAPAQSSAIDSIGIYTCMTGLPPETTAFFKFCGYNTYQRWDMGWSFEPSKHEQYYAETAQDIERMQQEGFKVYIVLSLNMHQRKAGEAEGLGAVEFDPTDEALMRERYEYLRVAVRKLKMADGFTIFAGDPGGHLHATPDILLDVVKKLAAMVAEEAPRADINVNTWGIAAWDAFPSPFSLAFWEKEVQLTRKLAERPELLGPHASMEFPLHNYYRSLAIKCYTDGGKQPEPYPTAAEVAALKNRGVKRLWGWPYFLTDECDDGYESGTAGITQSETRYLKQVIDTARRLGLNGMMANAFAANIFSESLNLYAFARFCKDPAATPEKVIDEFAGFLSEPESAAELAQVIRYIENRSTWQAGMPTCHVLRFSM
jgi:hypothetical protein